MPDRGAPAMTVDVIVPVHGRWSLTEACLRTLAAQTLPHRVIVVDDASPDDTRTRLAEHPDVEVVALSRNRGFAAAVNAGIAASTSDIVVLVNNDTECEPGMLDELVSPFADERVGSATPLLTTPLGTIDAFGICADETMAGYVRLHGRPLEDAAHPPFQLLGPYGAIAAYRRAAIDEVGSLDEGIVMYGEELDLALRLRAAGWTAAARPRARAVHLGGATSGRGSRRQRRMAAFGRGYLIRAWRVLRGKHAARTILIEGLVCIADAVLSRDLVALTGRIAGWRAGRIANPRPGGAVPGVDRRIGLLASIRLRAGSRA